MPKSPFKPFPVTLTFTDGKVKTYFTVIQAELGDKKMMLDSIMSWESSINPVHTTNHVHSVIKSTKVCDA